MAKINIRLGWLSVLTALVWVLVIVAVVVVWQQTDASEARYLREITDALQQNATYRIPEVRKFLAAGDLQGLQNYCAELFDDSGIRLTVIDPDGTVLADSQAKVEYMENHATRPEIDQVLRTGDAAAVQRFSGTIRTMLLYAAVPLTVDGTTYVLRASQGMRELDSVMHAARRKLFLIGLAIAAALSALSINVASKIVGPLRQLRKTAQRIAAGELDVPLPAAGPGEVGRLALPLGMLAEQLRSRYNEVRRQKVERDVIFDAMSEGVVLLTPDGHLADYNQAAQRLFGWHSPLRDQSFQALVRYAELHKFVNRVQLGEQAQEIELDLSTGEETRFVRVRGVKVSDDRKQVAGLLLVFTDVTRIRKLETFRREFIANVSHEIKTPLTVIQGAAETLLDGALRDPESATHFLDIIGSHCKRLNLLVQDILSIANLEEKTLHAQTDFSPLDAVDIAKASVEWCRPRLLEKQTLKLIVAPGTFPIEGDAASLEQAVSNLIDNAVKYAGETAEITVRVGRKNHEAVISVEDNGIGIPAAHLPRIFERFYRVDKARSRKAGGTGLGLSIVKHVAQWHHGQAEVESAVGEGSIFRLRLPLKD